MYHFGVFRIVDFSTEKNKIEYLVGFEKNIRLIEDRFLNSLQKKKKKSPWD